MRIGVPVTKGFGEFVKVTRDPSSNATKVSGFSIAVFDAVMAALPYAVPYEYIPFQTPDGEPAGDYNDLIYQVYLKVSLSNSLPFLVNRGNSRFGFNYDEVCQNKNQTCSIFSRNA